jgi:hypothetical protein
MSRSIRHASWLIIVALLVTAGVQMSSTASESPAAVEVAAAHASRTVATADAEAADVLVPQATCSAIKCPPGQICVNTLQCTPAGDCFHVGRCVSAP